MGDLLEKRSFQVSLGLIVILIWGFNMKNIADIAVEQDQPIETDKISLDSSFFAMPELLSYEYKPNFRDPFKLALYRPKIKEKPTKRKKPEAPIRFPSLKLTGVIEETAMIQNSQQVVFFAVKGDTVEGATVQLITPDSAIMIFKKKPFTVKF